ncbi:MAG: type II toxin-antitoxin system HicA family toxin [Leptolyngbyaceae cyanobacterium CSU_1_3]|nr:type II toxin-antitoxin system HicA family toxin [Leptolyngbyaceae cyanobacterium CSU_1_3]
MPKKVRELKKLVKKAGYVYQPDRGKGSHTFWEHPLLPDRPLCIPGKDGDDAPKYLEKEIDLALRKLEELESQEDEE